MRERFVSNQSCSAEDFTTLEEARPSPAWRAASPSSPETSSEVVRFFLPLCVGARGAFDVSVRGEAAVTWNQPRRGSEDLREQPRQSVRPRP